MKICACVRRRLPPVTLIEVQHLLWVKDEFYHPEMSRKGQDIASYG